MSDTADYQKLAARILDLWQEQLALMSQDQEYQLLGQEWLAPYSQAFGIQSSEPRTSPDTPKKSDDTIQPTAGPGQQNGPQTAAPASEQRDVTLRQLADTLRQFNERLDRLEKKRPSSGSGGKSGGTGKGS